MRQTIPLRIPPLHTVGFQPFASAPRLPGARRTASPLRNVFTAAWAWAAWVRAGVELANGEVVLADRVYVCAGPEASTRLLLHSGVGDRSAAQWDSCSIPCTVHNADVGKGYHDHPTRTSSRHHAAALSSRRHASPLPESRLASVCLRAFAVVDGFFSWRAYSAHKSKLPPYKASLFTDEIQVSLVTHGGYGFLHELDSFIKHKPLLLLVRLVHFLTPWWRHNREPFVFGGLFVTASFPDHRAQLQLHTAEDRKSVV